MQVPKRLRLDRVASPGPCGRFAFDHILVNPVKAKESYIRFTATNGVVLAQVDLLLEDGDRLPPLGLYLLGARVLPDLERGRRVRVLGKGGLELADTGAMYPWVPMGEGRVWPQNIGECIPPQEAVQEAETLWVDATEFHRLAMAFGKGGARAAAPIRLLRERGKGPYSMRFIESDIPQNSYRTAIMPLSQGVG